ncbi:SGNH/GDSL hydrolase family protein [Cysteiniphilum litorale]|uniref:SGNH/GDSL hydrolase family protein n=1 Tax=Cysteiniphilum litorale TaxID=2056700 RepID=UPI003F8810CC
MRRKIVFNIVALVGVLVHAEPQIIVHNNTQSDIMLDGQQITANQTSLIPIASNGSINGIGKKSQSGFKITMHDELDGNSANGEAHHWRVIDDSALDFHLNTYELGKAITWPGISTLEIVPTDANGYASKENQGYVNFERGLGDLYYRYGGHSLTYRPAQLTGAGSLQGTYFDYKNGYVYRWCLAQSPGQSVSMNFCKSPPSSVKKLLETQSLNLYADNLNMTQDQYNKNPIYYLDISNLPSNMTTLNSMYILGDSLSDTHNVFDITGGDLPKGVFYNGRWSNGLMWPDQLALHTGIPINNYAFGGAKIVSRYDGSLATANNNTTLGSTTIYMSSGLPLTPNLYDEINVALPSLRISLDQSINTGKKVLLLIEMGGNDFIGVIEAPNVQENERKVQEMSDTLKRDVNYLLSTLTPQQAGHLQVMVGTLPDLTYSAQIYKYLKSQNHINGQTARQFYQGLISKFNADIKNWVAQEQQSGVAIDLIDFASWVHDIIEKSTQYGLVMQNSGNQDSYSTQIWGEQKLAKQLAKHSHDSANFLGLVNLRGDNRTAITVGIGSLDIDGIIPYNPENLGKSLIGGALHPTAKTHFLVANHLIYKLYQDGYLTLPESTQDPYYNYLKMVIDSKGGTMPGSDFNNLIALSNTQHSLRPDFSALEQPHGNNGNIAFVHDDGSPDLITIKNATVNGDGIHCCTVENIISFMGVLQVGGGREYVSYLPNDYRDSDKYSHITIPKGAYSELDFTMWTATNFQIPTQNIWKVSYEGGSDNATCYVEAITHGVWGTTNGRCYNVHGDEE